MANEEITIAIGVQGPPGQGVPTAGLTDQVLKKTSDGDFDTEWAAVPPAGALNDVGDVTITTPVADQVLKWNGAAWVNATDDNSGVWGSITGTLSNQTDLQTELDGKSDTSHNHTGVYEPADATILKDADIGVSVQAYDATYLVDADIGVNVQAYDATILVDADIGVNVAAQSHTHVEADITDLQSYLLNITGESIKDLSDVYTPMTPTDGQVLTYDTTNGWQAETSPAGVTDHGLLSGLADDDHTQYHNDTRGDIRYYTQAQVDALTWDTSDIVSGTFVDARIAVTNVTQHQASLSITESQISDLAHFGGAMNDLSDVTITGVTSDEILKWNGASWVNNTLTEAGIEPADATILKDADIGVTVQGYDATILVDADIGSTVEAYNANIQTHIGTTTGNPHSVTKAEVGLSVVVNTLHKFDGTVAPTVTDDSGSGFSIGSTWVDTVDDFTFTCVDASVGAAVWINVSTGRYLNETGITGQTSGIVTVNGGDASLIDITACDYFIQGSFYQYAGGTGIDPGFGAGENSIFIGLNASGFITKDGKWSDDETKTIIPLARLNTEVGQPLGPGADVHLIRDDRFLVDQTGYRDRLWHERVIGALYQKGGIITENGTTPLQLDQSAGVLFDSQKKEQTLASDINVAALRVYHVSGVPTVTAADPLVVDVVYYDNGTDLTAIPSNKWVTHTLLKSPKGSPQEGEFFFIYGATFYSSQIEAEDQAPDFGVFVNQETSGLVAIAKIIVNEGDANVTSILDVRPIVGTSTVSTTTASTVTLQNAYDLSISSPQFSLDSDNNGIEIRDSATPIGVDLLTVADSAGTTEYLNVDVNGVEVSALTVAGSTSGIDHTELDNIGTNTHAQIDTHIADSTVHFTQASISITESQISDLTHFGGAADDLSDVTITTPADKHALMHNGAGQFVNRVLVEADVSDLQSYILASGVTYEQLDTNGDVGTIAGTLAIGNHTHTGVYEPADATILKDADIGVTVAAEAHVHEGTEIDATAITDGYVLTADGAGNSAWEAAAGGGLSNIVEDVTPQLGAMLDVNTFGLGDGTLELLTFTETGSAVNHVNITNAATANGPTVGAVGDDTNIDLNLAAKGTGNISIGNFTFDADQTVGAGQDNMVLTYDNAAGTIGLEAAGGGGSDYIVENWTGTVPSVTGTESMGMGPAISVTGDDSIGIGEDADITSYRCVTFGKDAKASGGNNINIGARTSGGYATGTNTILISPGNATVAGNYNMVITSDQPPALGTNTEGICVIGGSNHSITGEADYGGSFAGKNHRVETKGEVVFGSCSSSSTIKNTSIIQMEAWTANATQKRVGIDGSTSYADQLQMKTYGLYVYEVLVSAKRRDVAEVSAWKLTAVFDKQSTSGSLRLVGTLGKTLLAQDAGASSWDVTMSADTSNGQPQILVTGDSDATSIDWSITLWLAKQST